jgi:hypothetical protein
VIAALRVSTGVTTAAVVGRSPEPRTCAIGCDRFQPEMPAHREGARRRLGDRGAGAHAAHAHRPALDLGAMILAVMPPMVNSITAVAT